MPSKTHRDLPPPPGVHLAPDVASVVRYVAGRYAVHEGVALIGVLTAAGAVTGGSRTLEWQGRHIGLNLQAVLLPAVVAETPAWIDFLAAPLAAEVARLRGTRQLQCPGKPPNLKLNLRLHRGRGEQARRLRYWAEIAAPFMHVIAFPKEQEPDAFRSTLVSDSTGRALHEAAKVYSEAEFLDLISERHEIDDRRFLSLLLVADASLIAALKSGSLLPNWAPWLLPQTGNRFTRSDGRGASRWARVTARLLAIRRSRPRALVAGAHADRVLSAVKAEAEAVASRTRLPKWFATAVSTCAKLAGILHVVNGHDGDEPGDETWNDAVQITTWLIQAQALMLEALPRSMLGVRRRHHPPRKDDEHRMRAYLARHPKARYRDAVRGLPKRTPGYWRMPFLLAVRASGTTNAPADSQSRDSLDPLPTGEAPASNVQRESEQRDCSMQVTVK